MTREGIVLHVRQVRIKSLFVLFFSADGVEGSIWPDASVGAPLLGGCYRYQVSGKLLRSYESIVPVTFVGHEWMHGQIICEFLNKLSRDADISELFPASWQLLSAPAAVRGSRFMEFYQAFLAFLGTGEPSRECAYCQREINSYIVSDLGMQCDLCCPSGGSVVYSRRESLFLADRVLENPLEAAEYEILRRKVYTHLSQHVGRLHTLDWFDALSSQGSTPQGAVSLNA